MAVRKMLLCDAETQTTIEKETTFARFRTVVRSLKIFWYKDIYSRLW